MESEMKFLAEQLCQIEGIRSEQWSGKDVKKCLEVLQSVHNEIAKTYGFKPREIQVQDLKQKRLNGYCTEKEIVLSKALVENESPEKVVKTLAHESRHAYQLHAILQPLAFIPLERQNEIKAWKENLQDYKKAELVGFEVYYNQPVEVDARRFAEQLISHIYGEKK